MSDLVVDARSAVTEGTGPYAVMWDGEPYDLVLLLCDEIERLQKQIESWRPHMPWADLEPFGTEDWEHAGD